MGHGIIMLYLRMDRPDIIELLHGYPHLAWQKIRRARIYSSLHITALGIHYAVLITHIIEVLEWRL